MLFFEFKLQLLICVHYFSFFFPAHEPAQQLAGHQTLQLDPLLHVRATLSALPGSWIGSWPVGGEYPPERRSTTTTSNEAPKEPEHARSSSEQRAMPIILYSMSNPPQCGQPLGPGRRGRPGF